MAVSSQLLDTSGYTSETQSQALEQLLTEYKTSLSYVADPPSGQMNLARLHEKQNNMSQAEAAYIETLAIEPTFVPAIINLADLYRRQGAEEKVAYILTQALKRGVESPDLHHSLGLHYVRQKNSREALVQLERSCQDELSESRHFYVYAVALDSTDSTVRSIEVLEETVSKWSYQSDLLNLLVSYLQKTGRRLEAESYTDQLKNITLQ
jgi:predicted Zn-dependent protease